MSVTEYERHQIFQWFEEAMGTEKASIMMNPLPPVGWGDMATRADLEVLRSEVNAANADLLHACTSRWWPARPPWSAWC